jgi:pyruvate/2-oxoglutarate dehydrogenase complex dihydrolipoamide acyltransferase (E2) component
MAKDSSSIILLVGGAAVAYYGYTQGWFASFGFAPTVAAATASLTAPTPTMPAADSSTAVAAATPATSASGYSGLSLAAMFSALKARIAQSYGTDPALTCGGQSSGGDGMAAALAQYQKAQQDMQLASTAQDSVSAIATASQELAAALAAIQAAGGSSPATCDNPTSGYDNFNWYLMNSGVGVSAAPQPSNGGAQVTLTDYWAWVAPLLQKQIPGLAGLGDVYAGLGELVRQTRRGW